MNRFLINALSSEAGGAQTLLHFMMRNYSSLPEDFECIFLVKEFPAKEFSQLKSRIIVINKNLSNPLKRYLYEHYFIKKNEKNLGLKGVIHLGNFVSGGSSVIQVVYLRNSLFFSKNFRKELRKRGHLTYLAYLEFQTLLSRHSIRKAELVIVPSESFKDQIINSLGEKHEAKIVPIKYGIDPEFFKQDSDVNPSLREKLERINGFYKILHVGNYSYYKNFSLIIKMIPHLKNIIGENFRVILTTKIGDGIKNYFYDSTGDWKLMKELNAEKFFLMLGRVNYSDLSYLYRNCDVFIWPSYSESFGFPLLEARYFKLPAVSLSLPVNREVYPEALFFEGDERNFAKKIAEALEKPKSSFEIGTVPHIREHMIKLFKTIRERFF